jgi:hypothetical protein
MGGESTTRLTMLATTFQPNAKIFGADANSFRRRSISGKSRARDAEE